MNNRITKILIVDDHKMIRDGLKLYFEGYQDFKIAYEAGNGLEALEILDSVDDINLVLSDINMPDMDGIELAGHIAEKYSHIPVIALTMMGEVNCVRGMLANGASGYLLKNCGLDDIISAIKEVLNGNLYYSPEVTSLLINDMKGKKDPGAELKLNMALTVREIEVLKLIASEFTNQEIADELFISIRTVDAHKRNLIEKIGVKNTAGLVVYAVQNNLV